MHECRFNQNCLDAERHYIVSPGTHNGETRGVVSQVGVPGAKVRTVTWGTAIPIELISILIAPGRRGLEVVLH